MKRDKFSPGDRVVCTSSYPGLRIGEKGTYVGYGRSGDPLDASVRWDEYGKRRHSCDKRCEKGYGWFVPVQKIDFAEPVDLGELPSISYEEIDFLFGA